MNEKKTGYGIWMGGLGICLMGGLYTTIKLFQEGHTLFHANDVIVWSLPLSIYIFLALSSSGLAMLSALPTLFGIQRLEASSKRLVFLAMATLCGGFLAISLELGNMGKMLYFILSPNLASPIWWMGAIYTAELIFLGIKFQCLHKGQETSFSSKIAGTLSFICALLAPMILGTVFGMTEARAIYFGPMLSIFYLTMALYSGTALFILYTMVCRTLESDQPASNAPPIDAVFHRLFTYSAAAVVIITLLKTAVEWSTVVPEFVTLRSFSHPFTPLFGVPMEVVVGLFLPLILLMIRPIQKSTNGVLITALLAWIGSLAIHTRLLIAGQSYPVGPKAEHYPEVLAYLPSAWEWMVALFAISLMLLLYTLGERYLKLGSCRVDKL